MHILREVIEILRLNNPRLANICAIDAVKSYWHSDQGMLYEFVNQLFDIYLSSLETNRNLIPAFKYIFFRGCNEEKTYRTITFQKLYIVSACFVLTKKSSIKNKHFQKMIKSYNMEFIDTYTINTLADLFKLKNHVQLIFEEAGYLNIFAEISKNICENENRLLSPTHKPILDNNCFYCFKSYNSVYPTIMNDSEKGGGFFMMWNNFGIAIDPGSGFVNRLYQSGHCINDLHCIFISHSHDDHTLDLEIIYSLLNKYNKIHKENKHCILTFGSFNTYKKYSYFNNAYTNIIFPLEKNSDCSSANKIIGREKIPFRIVTHHAFHNENPYYSNFDSSIGFSIECLNTPSFKICYSGDTRFNDILIAEYNSVSPDILILNLGKVEECSALIDDYPNHLGINGVSKILTYFADSLTPPKLVLISEIGYEMKNYREQILNIITNKVQSNSVRKILPFKILMIDNTFALNLNKLLVKTTNTTFKHYLDISIAEESGAITYY